MLKKAFILSILSFVCFLPQSFAEVKTVDFPALITQGNELAQKGEWNQSEIFFLKAAESPIPDHRVQAYEGLSQLYKTLRLTKKANKVQKRLEDEKKFIEKLVPKEDSYYKEYIVKKGDTYAKIAAAAEVSLEWMLRANENKPLVEGKTTRLPAFKYSLVVDKTLRQMEWRRGDEVLKIYPVSIGKKETQTPDGKFKVISKVKNPIWYRLNLQIPPDSPENLLGTRWIGLDKKGYGIHGTRHPNTIRQAASHGCIRLYNHDVEELFEWLPLGTEVTIQ
jgi:lipoprotein-anchoring transpeptidase ErfK/SrfK